MWTQVRDAIWRIAYIGGWCLKYVQDAFGTDHPYPSASAAWNANYGNGNHPGEQPPAGKTVPVYFSLGNVPEWHVAISLDDGTVASSTQAGSHPQGFLHPNLQNLIDIYGKYNGGCTYLGWSEFVGTTRVLQLSVVNATDDQIRQAYLDILERPVDDGALAHYRAYTNDFVRSDLLASNERNLVMARHATDAAQAIADKQTADAETARLAQVAADKVAADAEAKQAQELQDAQTAQALKDAQTADAKARTDAALALTQPKKVTLLSILIETFVNLFIAIFKKGK